MARSVARCSYRARKHQRWWRRDARSQSERALALRQEKLGPDHLETLHSKDSLATAYISLERPAEALSLFEEAVRLRTEKLGRAHEGSRDVALVDLVRADHLVSRVDQEDAEVLLVVGAGGLAPHVILAHTSVRPSIKRVLIWNRTAARAEALAREMQIEGVLISAVRDLDSALPEADAPVP
jgi:hypothetical protein